MEKLMVKKQKTKELVIKRLFNAPIEKVWQAWTNPKLVEKWWGPQFFTAPKIEIDFREGGKYFYCMRSPDGKDYCSSGVYEEIVPMQKIVATDSFADEKGKIVQAAHYGLSKDFATTSKVTGLFEDIDGKTRLTIHYEGIPPSDMKNAEMGWNQSFNKLTKLL